MQSNFQTIWKFGMVTNLDAFVQMQYSIAGKLVQQLKSKEQKIIMSITSLRQNQSLKTCVGINPSSILRPESIIDRLNEWKRDFFYRSGSFESDFFRIHHLKHPVREFCVRYRDEKSGPGLFSPLLTWYENNLVSLLRVVTKTTTI